MPKQEQGINLEKKVTVGCSQCGWTSTSLVPADIALQPKTDRCIMANLNREFAKHAAQSHNGQAEMTLVDSTL